MIIVRQIRNDKITKIIIESESAISEKELEDITYIGELAKNNSPAEIHKDILLAQRFLANLELQTHTQVPSVRGIGIVPKTGELSFTGKEHLGKLTPQLKLIGYDKKYQYFYLYEGGLVAFSNPDNPNYYAIFLCFEDRTNKDLHEQLKQELIYNIN